MATQRCLPDVGVTASSPADTGEVSHVDGGLGLHECGEAARWLASLLGGQKAAWLLSSLVIRLNLLAQLGNGLRTTVILID
jgi:hypothetical protein